ncbi:hypothetical protein M0R04_10000 [Candidatus Dojkabacteria bacterium]|jgi:phosphoribosylamine--glycine ligase|nr:hypothetical protein [Candidatus Dojkabacteria bacterium]
MKKAYDFDGVVTEGILPSKNDIIITGRMKSEHADTMKTMKEVGCPEVPIFYCDMEDADDYMKAEFKSQTIQEQGVNEFYEDNPTQAQFIQRENPDVKVFIVRDGEIHNAINNLIIVTKDYSGLGFAMMAQRQGDNIILAYNMPEDEEKQEEYNLVGNGLVQKITLKEAMNECVGKNYVWIFDQNHSEEEAQQLRDKGEKVFGSTELTNRMEKDRSYAVNIMKEAGIESPETEEFTSIEEGLKYLDENMDRAFVFKPDDSSLSHLTFVPSNWEDEKANRELYGYIKNLTEGTDLYVLQERKKGLELNIEAWFFEGKPFFAILGLENKRKLNRDCGCNVGCAQDVDTILPLNCPLVQNTLAKLFPFYEKEKYTGFADMNVIYCDNKFYFLEVCNRFGYNFHVNLFLALGIETFGNIMCDFIDGKIDNFYNKFRKGFGASISLYTDHHRIGLPLYIEDRIKDKFYHYDSYINEEGDLLLAGYDNQVGVMTAFGYTIEEAAKEVINIVDVEEDINFPDMSYRSDLHKDDYYQSPIKRFNALKNIDLI